MEFWTSMYNMVSHQFPRDMKVGLPFTVLSRDDSLECTVFHTTIRFVFERSSSTWCHKAQYTTPTTLSLLRRAVPTKPSLHPQHVNLIHGVSTVSFMLPLGTASNVRRMTWNMHNLLSRNYQDLSPTLKWLNCETENSSSQRRGKEFKYPYVRIGLYILIGSSGPYFNLFFGDVLCLCNVVGMATCQVLDGRGFEFRQGRGLSLLQNRAVIRFLPGGKVTGS
jgi:hypothetical protein